MAQLFLFLTCHWLRSPHKATSRLLALALLIGLLAVCPGLLLNTPAAAQNKPESSIRNLSSGGGDRLNNLPVPLANAVRQDLSRRTKIPTGKLRVVQATLQTWPDGCLGLPKSGEVCTLAMVEGWRIVVSDNRQSWVYRTDRNGRNLRYQGLNPGNTSKPGTPTANQPGTLPAAIAAAVLTQAAQEVNRPVSSLRIVQSEPKNWADTCLGLASPEMACGAMITPGWRVVVAAGQKRLVYRTDQSGEVIRLDKNSSQAIGVDGAELAELTGTELPPSLQRGVVFRMITSGGIAGQSFQTFLLENGQVIRMLVRSNGTAARPQMYQLTQQQVREFEKLLKRAQFQMFDRIAYLPPQGAADIITVTLSSRESTVRYCDVIQQKLPPALLEVVQVWQELTADS